MQNLFNYKIITDGDMSTSLMSSDVDLSKCDGYSVYAKWAGAPIGTLKITTSLDGINYVDLSGSETEVNGSGDAMWEVATAFYDKIKVVFTRTSGTGTLNVQCNGKGVPD